MHTPAHAFLLTVSASACVSTAELAVTTIYSARSLHRCVRGVLGSCPWRSHGHRPRLLICTPPPAHQAEWMPPSQAADGLRNVHRLCVWLRGGISFWARGVYNPNSYHEANPVYRQIGRAEGAARSDISSAAKAAGASTAAGGASGGSARLDDAMRIGYLGDERELAKRCAVGTAAPRTPAPDASARCRHQRPYQGQTTAS